MLQKGELLVHYLGFKKYDLIIYDDIYPHPVSGFRLEEYTVLLTEIKKSKILLSPKAYPIVNTPVSLHRTHINEIIRNNLQLNRKLKLRKRLVNLNTKLFYCIFINNIYDFVFYLEKFKIPFVFTLYPGGGFQMNNKYSDKKLRRVLSSPMFRKVIVTQNITKDYLVSNQFCSEDQITLIFGCVVPQQSLVKEDFGRKNYLVNKETLDICFCAGKYMPQGIDKGYDVFIEVAHLLAKKYDFVKFHVIGGFDANDIDVSVISDKIVFYGYQKFENLESIFKSIDIIISPNKSFVLNEGSFDGFPLGTVVEAALNGVLAIISDDLNQNATFINNEELIIIKSDAVAIEKELINLIENPARIIEIAHRGQLKFQEVYSNTIQMKPRIDLLNEIIKASK
jgi:glycosyltransferase involved in cell wall biosynthesis